LPLPAIRFLGVLVLEKEVWIGEGLKTEGLVKS
jgi:hypothetical protein